MELNFEKYAQEGNSAVLVLQKGKSIDMYLRFLLCGKNYLLNQYVTEPISIKL